MANGRAKFKLGGIVRTLDVPLLLAIEIEDATGQSIAEMVRSGANLKFRSACITVGKLLNHHATDNEMTMDELLKLAENDGIEGVVIAAVAILNAFFDRPKAVKGTAKGNAEREAAKI
jgi:hypothetical protein